MIIINKNLNDQQLLHEIYTAAKEYGNLLGQTYLLIGKNRKSEYFWFECFFEKKNFMHLLGIKSRTLSANEFFDKSISCTLTLNDCTPSRNHNRTTINEKSSCCAALLRIQDAKYMNVGKKDKISQHVDFSYAYGKEATLGFQNFRDNRCYPITLIPKSLDEFTTKKYRIIFVFEKTDVNKKYKHILVEIKDGILQEHYMCFPNALKNLIDFAV